MASENAQKDDNSSFSILAVKGSNPAETIKLRASDDGQLLVSFDEAPAAVNQLAYRAIDVDETEEQLVDGDQKLQGYYIKNRSAAERFIHFYEGDPADITVGTTVPKLTVALESKQSANLAGLDTLFVGGITVAATNALTTAGTALGDNDVIVNIVAKAA